MEKKNILKAILSAYSNVLLDKLPLDMEFVNKFKEEKLKEKKLVKEVKNGKL